MSLIYDLPHLTGGHDIDGNAACTSPLVTLHSELQGNLGQGSMFPPGKGNANAFFVNPCAIRFAAFRPVSQEGTLSSGTLSHIVFQALPY